MKKGRIIEFDVARSLSMIYVICFWHLFQYSPKLFNIKTPFTQLLTGCFLGTFLYISGYMNGKTKPFIHTKDVYTFYLKRFVRIYPLFLCSLMFFFYLKWISLPELLESMFMINLITGTKLYTLWFISIILFYYALTPILLYSDSLVKKISMSLLIFIFLIGLHCIFPLVDYRLFQFFPSYAFGLLTSQIPTLQQNLKKKKVILISFLSLVLLFYGFYNSHSFFHKLAVSIFAFLLFIPLILNTSILITKIIPQKVISFISYISFPMYLFHRITFGIGCSIFSSNYIITTIIYYCFVLIPSTIIVSVLIQKIYDYILYSTIYKAVRLPDQRQL